jgi:alanine racemase
MSRQIRPTTAHVDLERLGRNFLRVRGAVGPDVRVLAAIKGDAYGHGAVRSALALEGVGCRSFGVALVEEGKLLRSAGIKGEIVCLGGVGHAGADEAVAWRLTPMVYDLGAAAQIDAAGRKQGKRISIHLKIDTGMGRLGVPMGDWEPFLDRLANFPNLEVVGLASHLAESEALDRTFTQEQTRRYLEALGALRVRAWQPRWRHLANTAGALGHAALGRPPFNMVRTGLALFGVQPRPDLGVDLEPVMRVTTQVLFVKNIPTRYGISYGRQWMSERPSRIATLPVGYADGYPRALSNRAEVVIRGHRCPIRGAVCMDMLMVDVTDVPEPVRCGDEVELMGDGLSATELAQWAGTIPYEILCGFSERVPRRFQDP